MALVTIIRNTKGDKLIGMVTTSVLNKCHYQNRGKLQRTKFLRLDDFRSVNFFEEVTARVHFKHFTVSYHSISVII
jgi:hypothetical protein